MQKFISFQTNKHLAEENEELNAQLLAQAVREGKHMLQEVTLAEELDLMTKEEVFCFSLRLNFYHTTTAITNFLVSHT